MGFVKDVLEVLWFMFVAAVVLLLAAMVFNGISFNAELGFYDSTVYTINAIQALKDGTVEYTYTHLDLVGILSRIFA